MSLITHRIKRWNEVIGQERVLRVIHAVLNQPHLMTRGLIFEGPYGVGKTTTAYLTSRALMCIGDDRLGCRVCPSCKTADADLSTHPAFTEVDAASYSGVQAARDLIQTLEGPANLGKRHVVVVDEAHRLSPEAWDVFLKPLEADDTSVILLFLTTAGDKIPDTITSRCEIFRFGHVATDDLVGKLMAIADEHKMTYTYAGLQAVATYAHGRPRDAIKSLGLVSATGEITPEAAEAVLNYDVTSTAQAIYLALIGKDLAKAVSNADDLTRRIGPLQVIETMMSVYTRDIFAGGAVVAYFSPLAIMTKFFLKWRRAPHLPSDVIPLFVLELQEHLRINKQAGIVAPVNEVPPPSASVATTQKVRASEFKRMLGN